MDVLSNCPLRVASLRWQARRGRWALTVVAKATYRLSPVACTLAEEQEDPNEHENHWDDDPRRSLYSPSDLVPFKPGPEVTLVGNAFAPRGEPVARLVARMIVGKVDKSIVIHGERTFSQDGALRPGARFRRMPLRYERAAGGPDTTNPVGMARVMDSLGAVHLPNLEPPGMNVTRPDEFIEPVGFAPIAVDWPSRREKLGRHAGLWSPESLATEPVPEWFDQRFFMSAPADQHLDELRPNERIVLENLHPDHARLVTNLPGWEPRAFVDRPRAPVADLPMTCDTLWIDTDRSICTLTWRGQLALDDRDQEGRVVIGMELQGRPLDWADVAPSTHRRSDEAIEDRTQRNALPGRSSTMPFSAPPAWPAWLASNKESEPPPLPGDVRIDALGGTGTLDVQMPKDFIETAIARAEAAKAAAVAPPAPIAPPAEIAPPRPPAESAPAWVPRPPMQSAPLIPDAPSFGAPPIPPPAMAPPPSLGAPSIGAPSMGAPVIAPPVIAPPVIAPPPMTVGQRATANPNETGAIGWLRSAPPPPGSSPGLGAPGSEAVTTPAPMAIRSGPFVERGEAVTTPAPMAIRSGPFVERGEAVTTPAPVAVRPGAAVDLRDAAARGVVAASNAAAAAAPVEPAGPAGDARAARAPAPRDPARDHVDLLWYDTDAAPRILKHRAFDEARPSRPTVAWSAGGESTAREPQEVKDRREIMTIVSRGVPLDEAGIGAAASDAYHDDGTFAAPLALIAGEISFAFDEIETLRATITVVTPFSGTDKKLKDLVTSGTEILKSEWRVPNDIAEGMTRRIEEAFAQGQRAVAPNYLESSVEKLLLEGRCYQKKTLFGTTRIRALFGFAGSAAPIPTYLPEDLAPKLPLFRRFKAKAIVEIRPQEDQYETHDDALLVLALGRLLKRG
ncbi:MAG: DUF2169 domain-containing protein [Minicystis sp.]